MADTKIIVRERNLFFDKKNMKNFSRTIGKGTSNVQREEFLNS